MTSTIGALDETSEDQARSALRRSGYVLVRGLVPPATLAALAEQVAQRLVAWGIAEPAPDGDGVVWNGRPVAGVYDWVALHDLPAFHQLVTALEQGADPWPRIGDLLLGRPSRLRRAPTLFVTLPDSGAHSLPPHQDGFPALDRGVERVRVWLPLFAIAAPDGGLAICPDSHRRGRYETAPLAGYTRRAGPGEPTSTAPVAGIDLARRPELAPRSASMARGDALAFDFNTVHFGLPTTSRRIRVAVAVVASGAEAPDPKAFHNVEIEARRREIALAAMRRGLPADAISTALVDLNVAGLDATPEHVEAALDGAHGGWREAAPSG